MKQSHVRVVLLIALGCAALLTTAASRAQESVCDPDGPAYRACRLYCDLLDCDGVTPRGGPTACDRLLALYRNRVGQDPPCLAPPPGPCDAVTGSCHNVCVCDSLRPDCLGVGPLECACYTPSGTTGCGTSGLQAGTAPELCDALRVQCEAGGGFYVQF